MRILVLSDLHLEFGTFEPPKVDVDVVVLAGDIDLHARGVRWANDAFSVPVLYLLGNHEFYGSRIADVIRQCREAAAPHVHLLDRDSVEIGGIRFIGCTLWTDFNLFGEDRCDSAMAVPTDSIQAASPSFASSGRPVARSLSSLQETLRGSDSEPQSLSRHQNAVQPPTHDCNQNRL